MTIFGRYYLLTARLIAKPVNTFMISYYIHLYSSYNMAAQANNTGTSKNTTNEKEKNNDSSTLET